MMSKKKAETDNHIFYYYHCQGVKFVMVLISAMDFLKISKPNV